MFSRRITSLYATSKSLFSRRCLWHHLPSWATKILWQALPLKCSTSNRKLFKRLLAINLVVALLWVSGGFLPNSVMAHSVRHIAPLNETDDETPTARGGSTQRVSAGTVVVLDGSNSTDPDGDYPLTYKWRQVGGSSVQLSNETLSVTTFIAPSLPTVMGFYLTVTDSQGHESPPDAVVVVVDESPLAGFDSTSSSPTAIGQSTLFTASVATTATVTYAWDFGDGITDTGPQLTHGYTQTGQYQVTVIASADNITAIQSFTVIVFNPAPVGTVTVSPTVAFAGSKVTLDATGSYDPNNNTPLVYTWVQIDGLRINLQNSRSAQPTFIAPSSFTTQTLTFNMNVHDAYAEASETVTATLTLMPSLVLGAGEDIIFLPMMVR